MDVSPFNVTASVGENVTLTCNVTVNGTDDTDIPVEWLFIDDLVATAEGTYT